MSVGRVRVGCMYSCVLVPAYCVCLCGVCVYVCVYVCVCGLVSRLVHVECMERVYIVYVCVVINK